MHERQSNDPREVRPNVGAYDGLDIRETIPDRVERFLAGRSPVEFVAALCVFGVYYLSGRTPAETIAAFASAIAIVLVVRNLSQPNATSQKRPSASSSAPRDSRVGSRAPAVSSRRDRSGQHE
jgi:hypothetical protein